MMYICDMGGKFDRNPAEHTDMRLLKTYAEMFVNKNSAFIAPL